MQLSIIASIGVLKNIFNQILKRIVTSFNELEEKIYNEIHRINSMFRLFQLGTF